MRKTALRLSGFVVDSQTFEFRESDSKALKELEIGLVVLDFFFSAQDLKISSFGVVRYKCSRKQCVKVSRCLCHP